MVMIIAGKTRPKKTPFLNLRATKRKDNKVNLFKFTSKVQFQRLVEVWNEKQLKVDNERTTSKNLRHDQFGPFWQCQDSNS